MAFSPNNLIGVCNFVFSCCCRLFFLLIPTDYVIQDLEWVKFQLIRNTIVYRNTWLGNTTIIFVIKQICWTQGHVDLTVLNTDIWSNMFIKFSKQRKQFFQNNTKVNSRPCHTAKIKLFPQVVTAFRGILRILPNI